MSAAERQRRRTERKRKGEMCVMLKVSRVVRDTLVEDGRLGEWDEDDKREVTALLQSLIDNLRPIITRDE